jgi:hypothetical protein
MLPIWNLENKGINNNALSLFVLMLKQQKSLVGDVILRGVKEKAKEDSKVSIKDKVDIKDKVSSKDNVFPFTNDIQVDKTKQTASSAKKSNCSKRKYKL